MKSIKPKKMPKQLEKRLENCANHPFDHDIAVSSSQARSILAGLAYERQRAEHHSRLRPSEDSARETLFAEQAFRHQMAANSIPPLINPIIAPIHYVDRHADGGATVHVVTPDYQRTQTAAVVPKPRKKA